MCAGKIVHQFTGPCLFTKERCKYATLGAWFLIWQNGNNCFFPLHAMQGFYTGNIRGYQANLDPAA